MADTKKPQGGKAAGSKTGTGAGSKTGAKSGTKGNGGKKAK